MRYGNQLVQTTVVIPKHNVESALDVLNILDLFSTDYGKRFGEGSQAPEAGIRINTIRVASYVEHDTVHFKHIKPVAENKRKAPPKPSSTRKCILSVNLKRLIHQSGIKMISQRVHK